MTDISWMVRQSEASTWDFCRRLHHFQYTRNLSPLSEGRRMPAKGQRDLGTVFHAGAEVLHLNGDIEDAQTARYTALDEMRNFNLPEEEELPELTKEDDKAWWDIDRYSEAMVTGYEGWLASGIDAGNRTLAVEWEWKMPLMDTGATLYGKIDLVSQSHNLNGVIVDDVKTVDQLTEPHRADFQLRTYALAWWRETGEVPRRAGHRQAKRVLRGLVTDYANPHIPINETILEAHENQLVSRIQDILTARTKDATDPFLYPRPTRDCSWRCPFINICVMVDDGDDYESVLDQHYYVREEGDNE